MGGVIDIDFVMAALGWAGAALSLGSYVLISTGRVSATSGAYQAMILVSATMLSISCASFGAWPSAVTNLIYLGIAVVTLGVLVRRRVEIAGRLPLGVARALARRSARRLATVAPAISTVSLERDEIDELLEAPQQGGLEIAVVAHAAQ